MRDSQHSGEYPDAMISPELSARLEALSDYVGLFPRTGTSREFWEGFEALEGDLNELAFAEDADPELRERFCFILANADDAGFAVPPELYCPESF